MNTLQLLDILKLGESEDLECKKSKNEVPKSLWVTYSAMAITNGGIILLGIDEVDNELIITGVENVDKVIKDFWSTLNGEKVNKNILKLIYEILVKRKIKIKGFNDGKIIEKIIDDAADLKNIKNIN